MFSGMMLENTGLQLIRGIGLVSRIVKGGGHGMVDIQFVIFTLGNEKYAVNIRHVSSITKYTHVTKVPNAPVYLEGVINLRGEIIPIINLKQRFGVTAGVTDDKTRIIISQVNGKVLGFIVDEAFRVIKLSESEIEPAPAIIKGPSAVFVQGIGKLDGEILVMLDLEKIMTQEEVMAMPA